MTLNLCRSVRRRRLAEKKFLVRKQGKLPGIREHRQGFFVRQDRDAASFPQDSVGPHMVFVGMSIDDRREGVSRKSSGDLSAKERNPRIDEKSVHEITGNAIEVLPEKPPRPDELEDPPLDSADPEHLQAIAEAGGAPKSFRGP